MRRPWIKVETATPDKPELCAIATALRLHTDAVLGKLIRLWSWVEVNRTPAVDLGVTKDFIDKLVGKRGFASAMINAGWLVEEGDRLSLKNLDRHNGGLAKVRALTAHRVAVHRKRKVVQKRAIVTPDSQGNASANSAAFAQNIETIDSVNLESHDNTLINNEEDSEMPIDSSCEKVMIEPVSDEEPSGSILEGSAPQISVPAEVAEALQSAEKPENKRKPRQRQESPDQPLLF